MYEELIKSLREAPSDWYDAELHHEAADAIEELSRECKALYAMLGTHQDPKGELGDPGATMEPPKEET